MRPADDNRRHLGLLGGVRLVSLCPSTTETIIALGAADKLVGITRFCIHPAQTVKNMEKVGGTKDPKLSRILELNPDLVFFNQEENRKEDWQALQDKLRVEVSFPKYLADIPEHLRRVGYLIDRSEAAETMAQQLQQELSQLRARPIKRRFGYGYLIWKKPWMAVGKETYVDDVLAYAGGENVFSGREERYPAFELEELIEAEPELVLLSDEPFPFKAKHQEELEALLPNSKILLVGGDDYCWHGVRSLRAVEQIRALRLRFQPE